MRSALNKITALRVRRATFVGVFVPRMKFVTAPIAKCAYLAGRNSAAYCADSADDPGCCSELISGVRETPVDLRLELLDNNPFDILVIHVCNVDQRVRYRFHDIVDVSGHRPRGNNR